jgi:hypothetical protein
MAAVSDIHKIINKDIHKIIQTATKSLPISRKLRIAIVGTIIVFPVYEDISKRVYGYTYVHMIYV